MKDSMGRKEGRHANGDSENCYVSGSCFCCSKRQSFLVLTTNDRTVDLDGRPNDGIAGGWKEQVCQADDGDDCDAGCEIFVSEKS